jgi:hypothetical protein
MTELKMNLEVANQYASVHSDVAQDRYVSYYNRKAKEKSFHKGIR